jgi:hypothetical protein
MAVAVDDHGASLMVEMMPPGDRRADGREGDAIVKRIDIDFASDSGWRASGVIFAAVIARSIPGSSPGRAMT